MSCRLSSLAAALLLWFPIALPARSETIDFDSQVRPILADRCFRCHGPDPGSREADLRLDEEAAAKEWVIVPGDAEASELVARISSDEADYRMPPPDSKLALTREEIALLRDWVQQGAVWQQHWSFIPLTDIAIPRPENGGWIRSPVDAFVLQKLQQVQRGPAPPADQATLLRRVSFALTGLPPSVAELDAFLADSAPDAYARAVDRLLQSKRYGERMAADWLDVARYSDTYGYQVDRDRYVWPYRDWVIAAFNQNMPYDQFITEQLAGDLLPEGTDNQILATTFNRLHPQEAEGGSIPEEFRIKSVTDRTDTFATAFLGLTMECCRCHDHKFDPISQREYYELSAFFDNLDEAGLYSYFTDAIPTPSLLLPTEPQRSAQSALRAKIKTAERQLAGLTDTASAACHRWLADRTRHYGPATRDTSAAPSEATATGVKELLQPVLHLDFEQPPAEPNQQVAGRIGHAVRLTGDDGIATDVGNFNRHDPFSVALWIQTPDQKQRAVVFHRSRAWTDAGSRGYELLIKEGHLQFALIHFWPGNAMAIKTRHQIPEGEWLHVGVTYDGSSSAGGLAIFINGQPAPCDVIRDQLQKNITGGGGDTITIGERFRDQGFTGGLVDEFYVFDRQLAQLEIRHLYDGEALRTVRGPQALPSNNLWREYYLRTQDPDGQQLRQELRQLRQQLTESLDQTAEIMVMRELPVPRASYLLLRGSYESHGPQVHPGTPAVLGPLAAGLPRNRLGLAQWLTQAAHPLTARVHVNRIWQMLFGTGFVQTPEDMGRQGERPTHPELLDWLAADFMRHGWDIQRLIKQIVLSATYQQSSVVDAARRSADPDNRWLARGPAYRLPAEMLRDNALAVSGLLVERLGGPPVKPYDVEEAFTPSQRDQGESLYRRSVYTYWKRTGPAPLMTTFDAALRDVCRVRRERTSTPLQALVLLNGPQFVEASRALADRVLQQHQDDASSALTAMFRMLTSRLPREVELQELLSLFHAQQEYFRAHPADTEQYLQVGDYRATHDSDRPRLAALSIVANALFSYDEVQMMR